MAPITFSRGPVWILPSSKNSMQYAEWNSKNISGKSSSLSILLITIWSDSSLLKIDLEKSMVYLRRNSIDHISHSWSMTVDDCRWLMTVENLWDAALHCSKFLLCPARCLCSATALTRRATGTTTGRTTKMAAPSARQGCTAATSRRRSSTSWTRSERSDSTRDESGSRGGGEFGKRLRVWRPGYVKYALEDWESN